ncbi:MAG: hypothetical protein GY937_05940 [bacterium]|nr:hypothetical protein [bacterium]
MQEQSSTPTLEQLLFVQEFASKEQQSRPTTEQQQEKLFMQQQSRPAEQNESETCRLNKNNNYTSCLDFANIESDFL